LKSISIVLKGEINLSGEGKFVIPGEVVGISEEFMPGEWTYEEEGNIFAAVTGNIEIDMKERKIKVLPKVSTPPIIKNGDLVIGTIWEVKGQLAIISVLKIKGVDRSLPGNVRGALHISKVREGYVSDLSREFASGDIIVAKVVEAQREPVELTTAGKSLGVVKAFCSKCGGPMEPFKNGLKCSECKHVESRKISSEYGKGET
jgi:exosome complex component CSL4